MLPWRELDSKSKEQLFSGGNLGFRYLAFREGVEEGFGGREEKDHGGNDLRKEQSGLGIFRR